MDGSNYFKETKIAPPEPPEPPDPPRAGRWPSGPTPSFTYREPHIRDPSFCYALQGPGGWHVAMVEKEPFPDAYVLTIWRAGDRAAILYRDTFFPSRGQLRDDDELYLGFHALLSAAVKMTTGSRDGWSMISRPLSVNEIIELDEEGELRRTGGESFSFLL